MLEYIRNPSPAIAKRVHVLPPRAVQLENTNAGILDMKAVKACFRLIADMNERNIIFHGYNSLESCVKVLAEFGVEKKDPRYEKCLGILLEHDSNHDIYKTGLSKVMEYFEDKGHSGSKAIRASLLVCSGIENGKEIQNETTKSLECFKAVTEYESLDDFAYHKNNKWIYREGKLFPDYYNLRILALSTKWRTKTTIDLMAASINRLIDLEPIPYVYVLIKGQLVAPGSYLMHDFNRRFNDCDDNSKAEWLLRNEYLARLGILSRANRLTKVHDSLRDKDALIGDILKIKNRSAFTRWGAYSGVSLEDDWIKTERKINDIAFRIGLIEYYSKKSSEQSLGPDGAMG